MDRTWKVFLLGGQALFSKFVYSFKEQRTVGYTARNSKNIPGQYTNILSRNQRCVENKEKSILQHNHQILDWLSYEV